MKIRLDREIEKLKKELAEMGNAVEEAIINALKALKQLDDGLAQKVCKNDSYINNLEVIIDKICLKIFALKQPIAIDLRVVASTLKVNSDLERMGDYAVKIAEEVIFLVEKEEEVAFQDKALLMKEELYGMGDMAVGMLRKALESFMQEDVKRARETIEEDNELDNLYEKFLVQVLKICEEASLLEIGLSYSNISKSLERIGDHAKNICEDAIYLVEGKIVKHKGDQLKKKDKLKYKD